MFQHNQGEIILEIAIFQEGMGGGTFVAQLLNPIETTLEERVKKPDKDISTEETNPDETELLSPVPSIAYSFEEEQFHQGIAYQAPPVDYLKLWYGDPLQKRIFEPDKEYTAIAPPIGDAESELLTAEEAQEAIVDVQYATIMGSPHDVDAETRRKLDFWIKFNPALFQAFEATYGVTREVNYSGL